MNEAETRVEYIALALPAAAFIHGIAEMPVRRED